MERAFLFPGQGSQNIGMGRILAENFAAARAVFQEVDEALKQHLSKLMWEGPEADLVLTENAQPAIMAASMAVVRVLESEIGLDLARHARLVAGHSLGEYTALCAAGAFALSDTARLLRTRGEAMQQAVSPGQGAMSALLGISLFDAEAAAEEAAAQGGVCVIANDNAPGQVVISGDRDTVDRAGNMAKTRGARRVMPLAVSAPFHSPLMRPAADKMREALGRIAIRCPAVPIVSNVTAEECAEPETIRTLLVEQVTSRVRWRESVLKFRSLGVEETVEAGGNKVLIGMVKRIDPELRVIAIDLPADIESLAKVL